MPDSHDNVTDIAERLRLDAEREVAWHSNYARAQQANEAANEIISLRKQLENAREALRQIKIEAEREQGHWQHLKRVIAVHATEALKG